MLTFQKVASLLLYSWQFPQVCNDSIVLPKSFEIDPVSAISGEYSLADNHRQVESINELRLSGSSFLSLAPWRPCCKATVLLILEGVRHSASEGVGEIRSQLW